MSDVDPAPVEDEDTTAPVRYGVPSGDTYNDQMMRAFQGLGITRQPSANEESDHGTT